MRIIIHFRWNDWHAHIEGQGGHWSSGPTIAETIGQLMLTHPVQIDGPLSFILVRPSQGAMQNAQMLKGREFQEGLHFKIADTSPDGYTPAGAAVDSHTCMRGLG